jgi:hypothetical protein
MDKNAPLGLRTRLDNKGILRKQLTPRFFNALAGAQVAPAKWQSQLKSGDYYVIESFVPSLPSIYGQIIKPTRERGYFRVKAHSAWYAEGEEGILCIVEPTRKLTQAEFEAARKKNWR